LIGSGQIVLRKDRRRRMGRHPRGRRYQMGTRCLRRWTVLGELGERRREVV
jgi:hypothetical protein